MFSCSQSYSLLSSDLMITGPPRQLVHRILLFTLTFTLTITLTITITIM